MTTRRELLRLLGLSPLALHTASAAPFTHPIGAQLYTVRKEIQENPAEVLKAIAKIGYTEVEVQDGLYPKLAPILDDLGLKVRGYRLLPGILTGNLEYLRAMMEKAGGASTMGMEIKTQTVEEAIEPAARAKMKYVVISLLLPPEIGSVDNLKRTAELFNKAGETCRKAGLTLCFHNHSGEFGPLEDTTAFDVLNKEFDPELVKWQIDVFWAAIAGKDPAALISEYGGRIASLHLKDMAKGTKPSFDIWGVPPAAFQPVGHGQLDFPAILGASLKAGVKHFFVEQDQTDGDPVDAMRISFENLRKTEVG